MPRKRPGPARTGTIYYDGRRKKWVAQLDADPITGKRPARTADTEREAVALLRQMQREREQGQDLTSTQPLCSTFFQAWLDEVVTPTCAPKTIADYRQKVKNYLLPTFGALRVDAVTPLLCQRWANELAKRVGASTVEGAYRRLRSAFDVAVEWYSLPRNPAARIRLPKKEPKVIETYTLTEVARLLCGLAGWRHFALLYLMVTLGLRKGEALALMWADHNKRARTLTIRRQVQELDNKIEITDRTKTKTSRRTLPVTERTTAILEQLWRNQQEERALLGPEWKEQGLMFPNEKGGPTWPTNFNRDLAAACKRAGVRALRVHDLRHTCATLLGALGIDSETRGVLLGHAAANVTEHYRHVGIEEMRAAVEQLERAIDGEAAKEEAI